MAEIALPTTGLEKPRQIDCVVNSGGLAFVSGPPASTKYCLDWKLVAEASDRLGAGEGVDGQGVS
jgi:hypothetical protein